MPHRAVLQVRWSTVVAPTAHPKKAHCLSCGQFSKVPVGPTANRENNRTKLNVEPGENIQDSDTNGQSRALEP
jgi:hypothetical protein